MIIRLMLTVCMVSFIAGCFNGMNVSVDSPACTVDEKSTECYTVPKEPNLMTEEEFFRDETNLMHYWNGLA